jgi:hypothetical protein
VASQLTDAQGDVLRLISAGKLDSRATNPQRLSARTLAARGLVTVKGRGPTWTAMITDAGRYVLDHDEYPPGHPRAARPKPPASSASTAATALTEDSGHTSPAVHPERNTKIRQRKPAPDPIQIDSPAGQRRRGRRPLGDSLFSRDEPDPYDEKILITVKEAAWMLSLTEGAIRQAVVDGDLDRVFIGSGKTHYRVVYGSLLAWVNAMPREPGRRWWWR